MLYIIRKVCIREYTNHLYNSIYYIVYYISNILNYNTHIYIYIYNVLCVYILFI